MFLVSFGTLLTIVAFCQKLEKSALIPQPVSLVQETGSFTLPETVIITTDNNAELKKIAQQIGRHK